MFRFRGSREFSERDRYGCGVFRSFIRYIILNFQWIIIVSLQLSRRKAIPLFAVGIRYLLFTLCANTFTSPASHRIKVRAVWQRRGGGGKMIHTKNACMCVCVSVYAWGPCVAPDITRETRNVNLRFELSGKYFREFRRRWRSSHFTQLRCRRNDTNDCFCTNCRLRKSLSHIGSVRI